MAPLLFLAHRLPYPPNKGDKIRSFNLLKHLARDFEIYLGTFIDDPADRDNVAPLREYCAEIKALEFDPRWRKVASLRGLLGGRPLTLPYYANRGLRRWVAQVIDRHGIKDALIFSSSMGQYVDAPRYASINRVIDFVDVDSEKWRAYAASKRWPAKAVYAREARTLFACEARLAGCFDHSLFVSQAEADLFKTLTNGIDDKISALHNGVDIDYFDPRHELVNPYYRDSRVLVFTGAMDYWANVDAVCWFATEVFGKVRASVPAAEFWIVGSRPTDAVNALQDIPGVRVTGTVDDVRPYIRHARAAVAPLRIARGIQNKVLEAMAMEKPVIATPQAIEGIAIGSTYQSLITENVSELTALACEVLDHDRYNSMGRVGREYVERHHDWSSELAKMDALFKSGAIET